MSYPIKAWRTMQWFDKNYPSVLNYVKWLSQWTGKPFGGWFVATAVFTYDNIDIMTFTTVVYGVYWWLKRKRVKKLESISPFQFFQMFAAGVKIGAIIAGLADVGKAIDPRKLAGTSIIADLIKAFGEFFKTSRKFNQDKTDPPSKYPGLGATTLPVEEDPLPFPEWSDLEDDDEDVVTFMSRVQKLYKRAKKLASKLAETAFAHSAKFAMFFAAVLLGVLLYLWMHHYSALQKLFENSDLEGTQKGQ